MINDGTMVYCLVGMIDTGVDDKSCFLIDSSGNITTRTPADEYRHPITEPFRRKVVQYITWGDGVMLAELLSFLSI